MEVTSVPRGHVNLITLSRSLKLFFYHGNELQEVKKQDLNFTMKLKIIDT